MKSLTLCSIVLAVTTAFSTIALGTTREDQVELLKGLRGVYVVVERLRPEMERDGLFSSTLQSDVEMKLHMAGIELLPQEDSPWNAPHLYLHVDAFKYSKGYVYRIQLNLREPVMLERKGARVVASTLRIPDELGVTPNLCTLREEVQDMLEQFVKIWQSANSKQGGE